MSRLHLSVICCLAGLAALGACAAPAAPRNAAAYNLSDWPGPEAALRLQPGDTVRVDIVTAPELSADLTVAADGRITPPGAAPVIAANLAPDELRAELERVYANELLDPSLTVRLTGLGSQKIFVGGAVRNPGMFDMPGEIDAHQAVLLAGGLPKGRGNARVIVMRRGADGEMREREFFIRGGRPDSSLDDIGPLQRLDVVHIVR